MDKNNKEINTKMTFNYETTNYPIYFVKSGKLYYINNSDKTFTKIESLDKLN